MALGFFSGTITPDQVGAAVGASPDQVALAVKVANERDQGKQAADVGSYIGASAGLSASDSAAAGTVAAALVANTPPHKKNPCPLADKWFDTSRSQVSALQSIPPEKWDEYTCDEKTAIMANPVIGLQAVQAKRAAGQVFGQVQRIFKGFHL